MIPHCFGSWIDEARVATNPRKVERQREAPSSGRENRIVDGVVNVAGANLADRALAMLRGNLVGGLCAAER